MISISDIYDKDINFLFGSGASFGLLPTLQLQLRTGDGDARYTLEELATKFERENDRRLIPLFMHYYANCILPAERLSLDGAMATDSGATVIKNYRTFLMTTLEMVKRRKALDRRCNVFTTNYDGCFPLVADALIREGQIDFVLNDGARGFTQRILQARNFGAYLCQAGVFGRYQSSIPQINLIHLHGSVYWSKLGAAIQVGYDLSARETLLDGEATAMLQPFSAALNNRAFTHADLPETGFTDEAMKAFWTKYKEMPIVNPTKWKFHETVYEEHYYQMLRLLSYELEKPNAVLITFGFSFSDEHILNLVMRSLSNPGLQVFVCCFNKSGHTAMEGKFKGYRNVQCVVLDEGVMDFTSFNEQVLAWPEALESTSAALTVPPAEPVAPAADDAGVEDLI
ncbi:SIR2 family protein [Paraburkholderia fungorum]|uniref:SIR2 family protein n=1 Tax=Paraburkholderia fungorum TaxID=134537 RepID=UPI002097B79A|nr:SIR2 family protein [Paraburkholderia fungorum]USX06852.1 SIR2 family protein [Paraburkholderia fungorum]